MVKNPYSGTRRLTGMAIFTAIIVVLQVVATFVRIGGFPLTLVLIPVVVGGAIYGPKAGAYFGGVFGVIVIIACALKWDIGGGILWSANPFYTALICMVKGVAAGWIAALAYRALSRKNRYLGVIVSAILCPIVNTGIFLIFMTTFFHDILVEWAGGTALVYYMIFGLVGINFLIELGLNLILSPTISHIIKIEKVVH